MLLNIIILFVIFYMNLIILKIKKNKNLFAESFYFSFFFFISVFFFFSIFYRIYNIFLPKSDFDFGKLINFFLMNFSILNLFLIIFFYYSFRNFIVLVFKKNFLKIHYFFLSKKNNTRQKKLLDYYINLIYCLKINLEKNNKKIFIYKYAFIFTYLFIFFFELIFNNLILHYSIILLPYFGLYQFCFICISFITLKMIKKNDFIAAKIIYKNNFTFSELKLFYYYIKKLFN